MLAFTDEELAERLEGATGERPEWKANCFEDLDGNVRESIERSRRARSSRTRRAYAPSSTRWRPAGCARWTEGWAAAAAAQTLTASPPRRANRHHGSVPKATHSLPIRRREFLAAAATGAFAVAPGADALGASATNPADLGVLEAAALLRARKLSAVELATACLTGSMPATAAAPRSTGRRGL